MILIIFIYIIEKDVQRTDRCHEFFEGDENQNLVMMKDILMTYNMYNFDLGKLPFFKRILYGWSMVFHWCSLDVLWIV